LFVVNITLLRDALFIRYFGEGIDVEKHFEGPLTAILGGTHLTSSSEADLDHVISVLRNRYMPLDLYLNHCTGERAYQALADTFGQHVKPCPAGTVIQFAD
jgi:metal-dependent hydrolase (beta-lactamase superfamily II)